MVKLTTKAIKVWPDGASEQLQGFLYINWAIFEADNLQLPCTILHLMLQEQCHHQETDMCVTQLQPIDGQAWTIPALILLSVCSSTYQ